MWLLQSVGCALLLKILVEAPSENNLSISKAPVLEAADVEVLSMQAQ